jgi:transcriptional regulator with XRE-family HTH domain
MSTREKLSKLLEHHNRRSVARAACVTEGTLRGVLAGRHEPRLRTLRALASVLGVDAGWLADDAKQWPPVRIEVSAGAA